MSTPEGRVLKACLDFLALNGIFAFRNNTGGTPLHDGSGRYRPAPPDSVGSADIIGIVRLMGAEKIPLDSYGWTAALAVEVKSAKGRQSPAQRAFQAKWEKAGGVYVLARSVDDLRSVLREAGVVLKV